MVNSISNIGKLDDRYANLHLPLSQKNLFWSLMSFLVVSGITLFTFGFIYYVQDKGSDSISVSSFIDSDNPFGSLSDSFNAAYSSFATGPQENDSLIDVMHGIIIILILLNVVIAVVRMLGKKKWRNQTQPFGTVGWI